MNVSSVARRAGAQSQLRLTNLLTPRSITIHENNGAFNVELRHLGVDEDTKFCLFEASPA